MSSNYPMGAEHDPRAPWNQVDPEMEECPECHGHGKIWYAYDFRNDEDVECTKTTWQLLPDDEDEATAKGGHFIKGDVLTCSNCDGTGEVEVEKEDWYDEDRRDYWRDFWAEQE